VTRILWAALFCAVVAAHFALLDVYPKGLYCDESSIGQNAALVAETGFDEHGERLPLYFKCFGQYFDPITIYSAALVFKVAGVSVYGLRVVTAFYFMLFWISFVLLTRRIFCARSPGVWFGAVAAGFLPWYFTLSRTVFHPVSQVAFATAALYCFHCAFEPPEPRRAGSKPVWAVLAGIFTALSIYCYSTGRLILTLFIVSSVLIYAGRSRARRVMLFVAAVAISLIPLAGFVASKPGGMVDRFRYISYLFHDRPLIEKISTFVFNYCDYFLPKFLIFIGDNVDGKLFWRHSTGAGGVIFIAVFLMFWTGVAFAIIRKGALVGRFKTLVVVNLLFSPLAGALTNWHHTHAPRAALMGLYMLLFAVSGFCVFAASRRRRYVAVFAGLLLVAQAGWYVYDYFAVYGPQRSAAAFDSYDFKTALEEAARRKPSRILISSHANQPYIHAAFYGRFVPELKGIPVTVADLQTLDDPKAAKDSCLIYFKWNRVPTGGGLPFEDIAMPDDSVAKVRCWK